jgi:Kef-type K+ transport system membrane component KefB
MTGVWALAALWLGLALIASLLSIWFRISTALSEIVAGTIAQWIIGAIGSALQGTDESWVRFLSGIGAIVLTFLAGAELDPVVFRLKWKEAFAVGFANFFVPFLGCAAAAHYLLGWGGHAELARRGSYVDRHHRQGWRLRTLTFGLLSPFYFIRAGSFVSIPALVAAPAAFILFQVVKIAAEVIGVYPVTKFFGSPNKEAMYTTLLMSTGLTFGTISSLFGLSHGIIDQSQHSALVAALIASAVIPTVIANAFYLPHHLLPEAEPEQASDGHREIKQLRPVTRKAE